MKIRAMVLFFLFMSLVSVPVNAGAAEGGIKDAESASHGFEASEYQVVDAYKFPGLEVVQFHLAVLSHYSYMVVSDGQALLVDPVRDVFAYLDYAQKNNLKIMGVFLTHNNADFVAGHIEVAKMIGCPIYIGSHSGASFPHEPLREGSVITVGDAEIHILETPGHTPESTSGVIYSKQNPNTPLAILTGDALFVGSVGRPDLMGGQMAAATLASMMFDTWTQKLSKLPDEVVVFPAHGAGSLCGAHLSDEPTSTIGAERRSNVYLQHKSRGEFIAAILEGLPEAPQYFKHNAAMNKKGPDPVAWDAPLPALDSVSMALTQPDTYYVVDVRDAKDYAAAHVPNSVNIGLRGRFETWVGIMVPWDANLVLVGSEQELKEAVKRLTRVGYSPKTLEWNVWKTAGLKTNVNALIKPRDLYARMQSGSAPMVVDVRLPSEWMGLRIGTVLNLPLNNLAQESSKLAKDQEVVVVCNSAYRSSMAVGVLERQGFTKVASLDGGSQAWIDAGLPTYGSAAKAASTSAVPKRHVPLPERMSPEALQRLMVDLPGTFDLVDIRPASAFADYSLPGSVNADIADVMFNPAYLVGSGPLILVDRDGSLAMAVGGVLAQKTKRPIKVLYGGLEAYWRDMELRPAVTMRMSPGGSMSVPAPKAAPAPEPAPSAPAPAPQKPKKKPAGC
ncbi:MBL fold metallo-hydrolase [Desulfosoma caldarium]|uniref:Glyoxylase-like metal-dependent hydrolase (Beta-lactamase superfamily II) n=1 Tax=Desulfosoma caldarium TaxID=610254 RepID=A0A3N1ULV5_9BACT|nr:rhodanese-like domain-containing protein [Desulfosoma caldarium]ROQ92192.1 glyoxylase-like metal-dependent hydrolase (beta-lactamase superfamily II) [Desulfosoma caldarium]